jgi:sugar phosphate isomerase/epimerase
MSIRLTGFSDEVHPDFERQLAVFDGCGVKAVEIRGVDGRGILDYTPAEAERLKKMLDGRGMRVSSIGSPIGKIGINDDFEEHFGKFENAVELCGVFGTPNMRVFSYYVPAGEADGYEDEVMRRTERLVDLARKRGVVLLHENEKGIYGDTAPRCLKLMKRFGGDSFRAVFDFANFVQCAQDTLEAYELLAPYIAYIHVKDAMKSDGRVVPAGWGDGHVKEILAALKAAGYSGYLSLEPHLTDFVGFARLERGAGGEKKNGPDGESAFRVALDSLKALLWELDWR